MRKQQSESAERAALNIKKNRNISIGILAYLIIAVLLFALHFNNLPKPGLVEKLFRSLISPIFLFMLGGLVIFILGVICNISKYLAPLLDDILERIEKDKSGTKALITFLSLIALGFLILATPIKNLFL